MGCCGAKQDNGGREGKYEQPVSEPIDHILYQG
jgi:hypothetical protein